MDGISLNDSFENNPLDGLGARTIGNMIPIVDLTRRKFYKRKICVDCKKPFEGGSCAKYCYDCKPFLK